MASSSTSPRYQVFVSHAGEDKPTIAIPLREMLKERGITAFVDEKDITPGGDATEEMTIAMASADIAIIVLSPEFVAKKWPMKELLFFLKRRDNAHANKESLPLIIPVFYRLTVTELYEEPRLERLTADGKSLYGSTRFFTRRDKGESEANISTIKEALKKLHGSMGVVNSYNASNDDSSKPSRLLLLKEICSKISQVLSTRTTPAMMKDKVSGAPERSDHVDRFKRYFAVEPLSDVILDFDKVDTDGSTLTHEARIKRGILQDEGRCGRVLAILGAGGVGKSTIMKGLANDEDMRNRFCDGIHIISLGLDATYATLFHGVCKAIRDSGAEKTEEKLRFEKDVKVAIREAISWFRGRSCAFLIDDVWTGQIGIGLLSHLRKLAGAGEQGSVVLTTREYEVASIAPLANIFLVTAREVRGLKSQRILSCHAGVSYHDLESEDECIRNLFLEVLDMCSGLPVSLAAAGKGVKMLMIGRENNQEDAWTEYVISLRICREQLVEEEVRDYGNLYVTFRASVALLDQRRVRERRFETPLSFAEMHRRLSVLQKQARAPASMLRILWGLGSVGHAMSVGMQFVHVGLAEREYLGDGSEKVWHLRVHDSLHDFATRESRPHEEVIKAHKVLVKGYGESDPTLWCAEESRTKWWSKRLKEDGYIHRNLCRHLKDAELVAELVELLKTPEWIARQVEVNDMLAVDSDFGFGIEALLNRNGLHEPEDRRVLQLIRAALKLSSGFLSKNLKELWFQLYGRLTGCRDICDEIGKFLDRMETGAREPWLRSINPFLASPGSWTTEIVPIHWGILCMAIAESKEWVVCGDEEGKVLVVNLVRSAVEKKWFAHKGGVTAVAIGKEGNRLVTGSTDGRAKVWDMTTGSIMVTFGCNSDVSRVETHHATPLGSTDDLCLGHIGSVGITLDGETAISAANNGKVLMCEVETGEVVTKSITVPGERIGCTAVFRDGTYIVSAESKGHLRIWNLAKGSQVASSCTHNGRAPHKCIAVTRDGKYIVSGFMNNTVAVWDVESENGIRVFSLPCTHPWNNVSCVTVSDDGSLFASGCNNGMIFVQNSHTGEQVGNPLQGHIREVNTVSFLGTNDTVVSCSMDNQMRMWDLKKPPPSGAIPRYGEFVPSVTFMPNGKRAISSSADGSLQVWDTLSGKQIGEPLQGHGMVKYLAAMPDGRRVISVCYDAELCVTNILRLWDVDSRQQLSELRKFPAICCLAVSPGGDYLVTGCFDGTVHVWNLSPLNGNYFSLMGHSPGSLRVFVSDDGLRIISVSLNLLAGDNERNTEIFVWDKETQQCVNLVFLEHPWRQPRRLIMDLAGEPTRDDEPTLEEEDAIRIAINEPVVMYRQGKRDTIIGTMEVGVGDWEYLPERNLLCVGLTGGQVGFMKLEIPSQQE